MTGEILRVKDLVFKIKNLLEYHFISVIVEGELSNLSRAASGHYYFTLSDEDASVSAALFKMDAFKNPIIKTLKDGDKICCTGKIGVYAKIGKFQIIVSQVEHVGEGKLLERFEKLKQKLDGEGLFNPDKKKKIPDFVKKVALITGRDSAAMHDFLNVFCRRSFFMDILVIPSLVQGESAPSELRKALKKVIEYHREKSKVDVIVFSRGGGSMEDLFCFNDENLARDIFACEIPIVSAVGHQIDFTICDFVSDLRAETPTAAAELLTTRQTLILDNLKHASQSLSQEIRLKIYPIKERLSSLGPFALLNKMKTSVLERGRLLDDLFFHMKRNFDDHRSSLKFKVNGVSRSLSTGIYFQINPVKEKLLGKSPLLLLGQMRASFIERAYLLNELFSHMQSNIMHYLNSLKLKIESLHKILLGLNPYQVLERGYSLVMNHRGVMVSSAKEFKEIEANETLTIKFFDGEGKAQKS